MNNEESEGMISVNDVAAYWHHPQSQQQQQHHHQHHQPHLSPHHYQQPDQSHYIWTNNNNSNNNNNNNNNNNIHHYQQQQLPQIQSYSSLSSSSTNQQHYYQQQVQLQNSSQAPPPSQQQQHQMQYHPHRNGATHCADRPRNRHYETVPGDPMITSSLKGKPDTFTHRILNRKQGKDGPDEKKDADGELWGNVEAQAAFLGPNLWDKTLPYDADLKVLNHYVDLDEFLSENGIPVDGVAGGGGGQAGAMQSAAQLHKLGNGTDNGNGPSAAGGHQGPAGLHLEPVTKRERSPSPSECCSPDTINPPSPADSNSGDSSRIQYGLSLVALSMASSGRDFDPRTRAFSDEELKPQPMIKKSRKQFVPDDLKDDKYWARRRKNNMAAKRSRDARRMKENQIALRAGFLEKENMGLRQELDRLKNENMLLRDKLSKYTDV
ncbi:hepatic leukemia factor-like isoform X3 [Phymastichus coffea]|uniref:hepatic leukemia factor-like isoform X3 n=1 Tax=Phymastichus coffea TaxID=108790 RepID=UPI00273A9203|nr:hepatic leukemia factor-like isoform X3 [Phymastichus coffea]